MEGACKFINSSNNIMNSIIFYMSGVITRLPRYMITESVERCFQKPQPTPLELPLSSRDKTEALVLL